MYERQEKLKGQMEAAKNRVAEIYGKRAHDLASLIKDIDSHPRVIERLKEVKEKQEQGIRQLKEVKEKQEQEKKTQEYKAKIEVLNQLSKIVQSMGDRHTNAFKRLAKILNNPSIKKEVLDISEDEKLSPGGKQKYHRGIGWQLYRLILQGEDDKKQIQSLKEIHPRLMPNEIRYDDAQLQIKDPINLAVLSDLESEGSIKAKNLLSKIKQITQEILIFDEILNRKNKRTGINILLMALDERRGNDKNGTTEKMRDIVKRGGFYVDVPQRVTINGVQHTIEETRQGAVLLEREGDTWKITEAEGAAKTENIIGKTSLLNMKKFPEWVQAEANRNFAKSGNDFTERITYNEEE